MSDALKLLLVEDDASLRDAVTLTLEMEGHTVTAVDGGPAALAALEGGVFNLVISDLKMEPMDGLTLLGEIRARLPQLPVMLMTAFGDVEKAVAAMQGGACDFLLKPFEADVLLAHVRRYAVAAASSDGTIAEDARTRELIALAARVAETDATVMLSGESGTGKEVFARYIHAHSQRRAKPFVAINCAAIPDNLLEATLFGHEKGAFTGAQTAQAGKFEQADGGTLLLDEISEMPLGLQAKLLRVLQEREVERVGGKKPIHLDLRVLATSNRDMAAEVAAGRFREDLYYRLNVFPLAIPSLRERPGDILPLARHFLARHGERIGRQAALGDDAAELMLAHPWPGNARELDNAMQRALILANGGVITAATLKLCLGNAPRLAPASPAAAPANIAAPAPLEATGNPANMKDLEREHILSTLRAVGGSRKKAVEKLGISERTLRYKLQQYRDEGHVID
jgi:two-component system response regulator FlrC